MCRYCGFKQTKPTHSGEELLKYEQSVEVLLDLLFASSSPYYEALYEEGLILSEFGFDFEYSRNYSHFFIQGQSVNPEKVIEEIESEDEPEEKTQN